MVLQGIVRFRRDNIADREIIAIGYPDEQPQAKPRDMSKVKYIK